MAEMRICYTPWAGRSDKREVSPPRSFHFLLPVFVDSKPREEPEMLELLELIFFTAAVSFLLSLVIAKLASSSSSPTAPAGHIRRRRRRHGCVEISVSVGGDRGGEYVVIEEEMGAQRGTEEFRPVELDLGRREGDGEALEEGEKVEVEFVARDRSRGLDSGEFDVALAVPEGDNSSGDQGRLGVTDGSSPEEETVVNDEIHSDGGSRLQDNGEQSHVGGVVGDPGVVSSPVEEISEELRPKCEVGEGEIEDEEGKALSLDEDDDWEGIEKSATGELFGVASAFVGSVRGREALSRLSSELQLQLYGLYKIATEGPCYQMQPLALKASARSKWHAWKKLGNMNPEMAMEQYITFLTKNVPEWMEEENCALQRKMEEGNDSAGAGVPELQISQVSTSSQHDQQLPESERKEVYQRQ